MIPAEAKALLGRILESKLQLTEYIGAGAVGFVFKAHHRTLNKSVAIKVLQSTGFGPAQRERFALEAQTAAQFDHPNSVRVLDFGQDRKDGLLYIAMELLDGRDLAQLLRAEGPLDGVRLSRLMLQVLAALAAAHDQGVIHRDIKSANIMVLERRDDDGELVEHVKVCDFGLAKMMNLDGKVELDGHTQKGIIMGTPNYMSPEQAVGEPLDPKTDVYSAGIVMFEMLTGRVPFRAKTPMQILLKQIQDEPPRPSSIVPSIHPELEEIVLRAISKRRDERPTARELRRSLNDHLRSLGEKTGGNSDVRMEVPVRKALEVAPPAFELPIEDPMDSVEALPLDAILGPPPTATPVPARKPETTDDLLALVNEAVAEVEESAASARVQDQISIAGLDHRKHGSAVADLAREVFRTYGIWLQPYQGPHGILIRDPDGLMLGPLDYKDTIMIVKRVGERGLGDQLHLSDGERWMNATQLVKLTGQEALLRRPPPPNLKAPFSGSLRTTSLPALFARVMKDKLTGRLYFKREGDEAGSLEIHLVLGAPTFVLSDLLDLTLPAMLLQKDLITHEMLPKFIVEVIRTERSLAEILAREIDLDVARYQSLFMRDTVAELFRWRGKAIYSFDPQALPGRMEPLASSMFALLPELVYRTMSVEELAYVLHPYADQILDRSEKFAAMVHALILSPPQISVVRRFGSPRTIAQALGGTFDNKLHLTIAYILIESGMLLKPLGAI